MPKVMAASAEPCSSLLTLPATIARVSSSGGPPQKRGENRRGERGRGGGRERGGEKGVLYTTLSRHDLLLYM